MSLTILNKKLDALNEKERLLRQTYDVRGTNKHQHRYIKDLKEDFKEDLILRYGNKPYGLGWHENELAEEEEENHQNEIEDIPEDNVVEEEEENDKENDDFAHGVTSNNFRPGSGRLPTTIMQNRPFSASVARPMTASSAKGGSSNSQMFMFQNRPISAIGNNTGLKNSLHPTQEISEFNFQGIRSPQGLNPSQQNLQASLSNHSLPTKMKVNESMFWKNTKKFDISKSTKQFDTKNLLFEIPHSNPKMIAMSDLTYLKDTQMDNLLEASKLKPPKNYEFQDIALTKKGVNLDIPTEPEFKDHTEMGSDDESDAKVTFNQSLSYIQLLRLDTPSDQKISTMMFSHDASSNRIKKLQRPMTAHPMISTTSSSSQKKPLEIIAEADHQRNRQIYFSSLSDLRKKAFFLKLNSIEHDTENHPNSNREIKAVDWQAFQSVTKKEDFQSLQLLMLDLNTFDHVKYELEWKNNSLKAKFKDQYKDIANTYGEFLAMTKTNLAFMIIFYETTSNKMVELFGRVLVFEKQENEYDIQVWRNIYRFLLHKLILANSPLYPNVKTYKEFSKIIQDIIEDRADYVSPIVAQIQQTKHYPVIVERNGFVYNFDFHSYIYECSSFYANILDSKLQSADEKQNNLKGGKTQVNSNKKMRPFSAIEPKKSSSDKGLTLQAFQRVNDNIKLDSNIVPEPLIIPSPKKSAPNQALPNRPNTASIHYKTASNNLNQITEEGYDNEKVLSSTRKSYEKRTIHQFLPSSSKKNRQDTPEMALQGDRMEIFQKTSPTYSQSQGRFQLNQLLSPSAGYASEYGTQNLTQFSSPKAFPDIFEHDPNGITVRYKKSLVKKKNSMIIKRPQSSYVKKPITPHKNELSVGGLGSGRIDRNTNSINLRFKF